MTDPNDFLRSSYRYDLPPERIAQTPPCRRGSSRLLVLDRQHPEIPPLHTHFSALPELLPEGALLVANNSRVLPARVQGLRPETGGKVEFLLLTPPPLLKATPCPERGPDWQCAAAEGLVRTGGRVRAGDSYRFGDDLRVTVRERGDFGHCQVHLEYRGDAAAAFAAVGHIPLPPYIRRADNDADRQRYQTVYARKDKTGSVAAPTAGLHFTEELRQQLAARGIHWVEATLYVGYGTFSPVRCDDIRAHKMHREYIELSASSAAAVRTAKAEGRPVIAVGTTSVRILEGTMRQQGRIEAYSGWTDIFLYPSQPFQVIDGLITNFHLPESTLLMLVAAFAGRKRILDAYAEAVHAGYHFFSYGDAMLIR